LVTEMGVLLPLKDVLRFSKERWREKNQQSLSLQSSASLSKVLRTISPQWRKNINTFFLNSRPDLHAYDSSLTSIYWRKEDRREYGEVAIIRDMFDSFALYSMAMKTGYHYGQSWKNGGLQEFVNHINAFSERDHTTKQKEKNLKEEVAAGCYYRQWIDCLTNTSETDISETDESETDTPETDESETDTPDAITSDDDRWAI